MYNLILKAASKATHSNLQKIKNEKQTPAKYYS